MSLIEVKGLKKSFGSLEVLKGIDLNVEQGQRIAIIGGSGCGKSVFLRSVCLLEKPDAGQILIDGQEHYRCQRQPSGRNTPQYGHGIPEIPSVFRDGCDG